MKSWHGHKKAVGWASIALGLGIAVTPAWAQTTEVGLGFTLGMGALTVMYGAWSLIARDPTRDHWAMSVVGLVLAIAPWVGGYAGDSAAWVSWIGGTVLMIMAGAAYIGDEAGEVTVTERVRALARYQAVHGIPPGAERVDDGDRSEDLVDALPAPPARRRLLTGRQR